jgi:hypothetical protein
MAKIYAGTPEAEGLVAVDAATGEQRKWILWADPETGEYEEVVVDENGAPVYLTTIKHGDIRLERAE